MAATCSVEEVSSLDGLGFPRPSHAAQWDAARGISGLGDANPNIFSLLSDPENAIQRITIESEWTPAIVMDKPFAGPSTIGPLEKLFKPKITVELAAGAPLVIAPAGSPGTSKWPLIAIPAALVIGGVGIFAAVGIWHAIAVVLGRR